MPDDADLRRPNYLATLSLVLGLFTLIGQMLGACLFWCTPFVLAVPTGVALLAGWYGLRQARESGVGRDAAIVGLVLSGSSLAVGAMWLALTVVYGLLTVAIGLFS